MDSVSTTPRKHSFGAIHASSNILTQTEINDDLEVLLQYSADMAKVRIFRHGCSQEMFQDTFYVI